MLKTSGLILDVKAGDTICIGDLIGVEILQKSGQKARLRITAPPAIMVTLQKAPIVLTERLVQHESVKCISEV